jgi:hypothetical protein
VARLSRLRTPEKRHAVISAGLLILEEKIIEMKINAS